MGYNCPDWSNYHHISNYRNGTALETIPAYYNAYFTCKKCGYNIDYLEKFCSGKKRLLAVHTFCCTKHDQE